MRVSNTLMSLFSLNAMLRQQSDLSHTQLQISTGQRLLAPADDPYGSSRAINLDEAVKINVQFTVNAEYAQTRLSIAEGTLDNVSEGIQRVRELAVYGNNASQTSESRRSIAEEIKKLLDQFIDLANTADPNKEYLFAGYQGKTKPFGVTTGGGFNYFGDDGQRELKIGTSTHVEVSDAGDDVFMSIKNGNGVYQTNENVANTGTGIIDPGSVVNTYIPDTFTVKFIELPSGGPEPDRQYYVVNSAGNVVVFNNGGTDVYYDPATSLYSDGSAVITEAALLANISTVATAVGVRYQEGNQLFGIDQYGIQTAITGVPAGQQYTSASTPPAPPYTAVAGSTPDTFVIQPSQNQSLFQTVKNLVDALESNQASPSDKAHMNNAINRVIIDLDQNMGRIIDVRSRIGARLNILDRQRATNESFNLQMNTTLSEIRDLDYASAVTKLNLQMNGLTAAQQTYSKIQGLSLFNYLR